MMNRDAPHISVVLPTYNRSESLRRILSSLERQTLPASRFEVIVVDDGSTDGTASVAGEFVSRGSLRVEYIRGAHEGPGASRNRGVSRARGGIIAFIEDDVTPEPDWLARAEQYLQDPAITGVEGKTIEEGSARSVRSFDPPEHLSFIPCNLFLRKEAFVAAGGYDPAFFNAAMGIYFREDIDLGFTLLERRNIIKKVDDVVVAHPPQFRSANDILRHCRRFYFDPLLFRKHRRLFRSDLETKHVGPLLVHRPFHYLSMFYLLQILIIFMLVIADHMVVVSASLPVLLVFVAGIRYRYRKAKLVSVLGGTLFLVLPCYYYYWLIRGCFAFRSWGVLY